MNTEDITAVSHVSAEQADAWYQVVAACAEHDLPGQPPPSPKQVRARLGAAGLDSRRLFWLATGPDGVVFGVAGLRLFDAPGQRHLGELELSVRPDQRRLGVGSRLLTQVMAAARSDGRRSVVGAAQDGGAGAAFCDARGAKRVLTLTNLSLAVVDADTAPADVEHPGYELASWTGTAPEEFVEAFAVAKNAMNDMPTGDMDYGEQRWDADRVRAMARVVADRGDTLLTVAALSGEVVSGFTEIVIPGGEPRRASQYDTVVVPEHRGHGVGLWLKAAMVRRLRAEHPGIVEIETDNAEDNPHMLAVNQRLGFRPHRRTHEYQLEVRPA